MSAETRHYLDGALSYDQAGQSQDACISYMESLSRLAGDIKVYTENHFRRPSDGTRQSILKVLNIARHCIDRTEANLQEIPAVDNSDENVNAYLDDVLGGSEDAHEEELSISPKQEMFWMPPQTQRRPPATKENEPEEESSFLRLAHEQNRRLHAGMQKRIQKIRDMDLSEFQKRERESQITLRVMRQCVENIAIARKRDDRRRAEVEEHRRQVELQSTSQEAEQSDEIDKRRRRSGRLIPFIRQRIFHKRSSSGLQSWLSELDKLHDSSTRKRLIEQELFKELCSNEGSWSGSMKSMAEELQARVRDALQGSASSGSDSALKNESEEIFQMVRSEMASVADSLRHHYYSHFVEFEFSDIVMPTVERALFPHVYSPILDMLIYLKSSDHKRLVSRLEQLSKLSLCQFGVEKHFLLSQARIPDTTPLNSVVPYGETIRLLKLFPKKKTPREKVDTLREAMHAVSSAVPDYWEKYGECHSSEKLGHDSPYFTVKGRPDADDLLMGADNLLPVLCYAFSQAFDSDDGVCLAAEISFLEEFTDEEQLLGDAGYCLATLTTVVNSLCYDFV